MKVVKRDGREINFDKERIIVAIQRAIVDVEHKEVESAEEAEYPFTIADIIEQELEEKEKMTVEEIQDHVEFLLMSFEPIVAKAYILFRFNQKQERKQAKIDDKTALSESFISKYKKKQPPMTPLGNFVYYRTYSRFLPEAGRREFWWETAKRAVEFNTSLAVTPKKEIQELFDNIFNLRQFLSGRTFWVGGNEVSTKYPLGNFNCAALVIDSYKNYLDLFYLLLVGAGVGVRVLPRDVEKIPPVRTDIKMINKSYIPVSKKDRIEYTSLVFEDDIAEIVVGDSKEGKLLPLMSVMA